jgi:hypothetical protein
MTADRKAEEMSGAHKEDGMSEVHKAEEKSGVHKAEEASGDHKAEDKTCILKIRVAAKTETHTVVMMIMKTRGHMEEMIVVKEIQVEMKDHMVVNQCTVRIRARIMDGMKMMIMDKAVSKETKAMEVLSNITNGVRKMITVDKVDAREDKIMDRKAAEIMEVNLTVTSGPRKETGRIHLMT